MTTAQPAPHIEITRSGQGERTLVFLHGLMGRGKNFTRFAKELSDRATVLLVDLPNHGRSDWTDRVDYREMADQISAAIAAEVGADRRIHLVGHSMGGKVAMALALQHPEQVAALMVVDISPAQSWKGRGEFPHLLGTLQSLDLSAITDRSDADRRLSEPIDDARVRGFLLQNLRHGGRGFHWQPNLDLLHAELDAIGGFPEYDTTYDGPVLWVAGGRSDYIRPEFHGVMRSLFPRTRRVTVKQAGHWVHSEQPEQFSRLLTEFLG